MCRETELVNVFVKFYQYQTDYQHQASQLISGALPVLANSLGKFLIHLIVELLLLRLLLLFSGQFFSLSGKEHNN